MDHKLEKKIYQFIQLHVSRSIRTSSRSVTRDTENGRHQSTNDQKDADYTHDKLQLGSTAMVGLVSTTMQCFLDEGYLPQKLWQ